MPQVPTVIPDREKIRQLRLEAGLSPAQLADKLPPGGERKRHGQTIRKIESDGPWAYTRVSELLIYQIAKALGVKAAEIVKPEPDEDAA
jgi:transcriptional regulator with XRE-family HTH domain